MEGWLSSSLVRKQKPGGGSSDFAGYGAGREDRRDDPRDGLMQGARFGALGFENAKSENKIGLLLKQLSLENAQGRYD